jgi:hypothetical protein
MTAYQGTTGKILWNNSENYGGPCLLWKDRIITNGGSGYALDVKTGKKLAWKWSRQYGCNTAIASQNLMTFRSGAAGFYDLEYNSGTANLGGFKSSCTANLIPANGLLNAPDYTRTCSCAYQLQTSLALINMPESELWAFGAKNDSKRFGLNFGAPGDRRSESKTLWLDYPSVGGKSDDIKVKLSGKVTYTRRHSSLLTGELPWVVASNVSGVERLEIPLPENASYTVKLYFAELDNAKAGERVFDIKIQGKNAISALDPIALAKGNNKSLHKTFKGIKTDKLLTIEFIKKSTLPAIINGIEIIKE